MHEDDRSLAIGFSSMMIRLLGKLDSIISYKNRTGVHVQRDPKTCSSPLNALSRKILSPGNDVL